MKTFPFLRKNFILFAACQLLLATLIGCGYTTRSMITGRFRTIYIPQFSNKIDITKEGDAASRYKLNKPLLEVDITNRLVNRFLFDGNLRPAKSESADLTLEGELVEFKRDPVRYSESDNVEEYRVSIIVNIRLVDNRENKILWEENNFTGDATYFTQGANAKTDDVASNDAVNDLTRRIVERVVEEW
jgi:hypothetical protein